MKKKDYMKPTMKVVKLQHRHQILAVSYKGIKSKNSVDDEDNPIYDDSTKGSIWDAN